MREPHMDIHGFFQWRSHCSWKDYPLSCFSLLRLIENAVSVDSGRGSAALPWGPCYIYHYKFILSHYICTVIYQFIDMKSLNYNAVIINIVFTCAMNLMDGQWCSHNKLGQTSILKCNLIKEIQKARTKPKKEKKKKKKKSTPRANTISIWNNMLLKPLKTLAKLWVNCMCGLISSSMPSVGMFLQPS